MEILLIMTTITTTMMFLMMKHPLSMGIIWLIQSTLMIALINPLGSNSNNDKMPFHPYLSFKDIVAFLIMLMSLTILTPSNPYMLENPNNFIPPNPLMTPVHI